MLHPSFVTRPLLLPVMAAAFALSAYAGPPSFQSPPQTGKKHALRLAKPEKKTADTKSAAKQKSAQPPAQQKKQIVPAAAPVKQIVQNPSAPRQFEGDGPGGKSVAPGQRPRPNIPSRQELLARVPQSGPLTLEHLILLAIANDLQLDRRRADILGASAAKESARDLPNPELRLSYSSEDEDQLQLPYTDTVLRSFSPFPSQSYQEIERIVTPGRQFDSYTINNYDIFNDGVNPLSRTLTSTSYEQRSSTEVNDGGEQTGAMIRFSLPNLRERKARIERAAAEVLLAEAQYLADEDKLVREVRELYDTLSGYSSEQDVHEKRIKVYKEMRAEMENPPPADPQLGLVASFAFEAARARTETLNIQHAMRKVQRSYNSARSELAMLCGIRDETRISARKGLTRRVVDTGMLDEDYLVEIAMLYRADVVELSSRRDIAAARLAEAKASGRVFATFFDMGWNGSDDNGRSGRDDEFYARLGISIPLWDLTKINKSAKAYEAFLAAMDQLLERQKEQLRIEIQVAIRGLKLAAAGGRQADGDVNEATRESRAIQKGLSETKLEANDIGKLRRSSYDGEDFVLQTQLGRISAWSEYNLALRRLEDAIGTRIEKALAR